MSVELGDLLGEREPAASQAGESKLGCTEGRGRVVAAHTSRFGNPFAFFQADELGPKFLGGGVDHRVDLVGRLRPGLHCASPGNSQQPDRLDGSRGRLRGADRLTGEHGSCGCLGIGRVGLAALSAGLAVRSVHLDHLHAGIGQKPGQPGTPRAGAFHSDRAELAESAQPPEQRSISAESRRELLGAEHPAQARRQPRKHGSPCVCRRHQ